MESKIILGKEDLPLEMCSLTLEISEEEYQMVKSKQFIGLYQTDGEQFFRIRDKDGNFTTKRAVFLLFRDK